MNGNNKTNATTVVLIVAVCILFCISIAGVAGMAYLTMSKVNSDKKIASLETQVAALSGSVKDMTDAPKVKLGDLTLNFSSTSYSDYYDGVCKIDCDSKEPYLVLVKQTLKSGGTAEKEKIQYLYISVTNGEGEINTYDYADKGKLEKPSYEFEVMGFIKTNLIQGY